MKMTQIVAMAGCAVSLLTSANVEKKRWDDFQSGYVETMRRVNAVIENGKEPGPNIQDKFQAETDRIRRLTHRRDEAVNSSLWQTAITICLEMEGPPKDTSSESNVQLALLYWNLGKKDDAIQNMMYAVEKLKDGKGSEKRAQILLNKMEKGAITGEFNARDILGYSNPSLLSFVMKPRLDAIKDASIENYRKRTAHLDRLIARMNAEIDVSRAEEHHQAMLATFNADMDYLRSANKTFDPNNRPPLESAEREDWDACKRIHDIFDTEAGADREDSRAAEPGGRGGAGRRYAASAGVTAKEESGIEASVSRDILPKDAKHGQEAVLALPGGATMEMIYVAPGSFMMGSPTSEEGRYDDEKQHQVTLTKGFWLGKYEVTQAQWQSVMGENPSKFKGDSRPVENVSWEDCQRFIAKINAEARRQFGGGARLPTEAEWEYACRAGTTTAFSWGNALNGDRANCDGNDPCGTTVKGCSRQGTADVGSYSPNAWGFYDMHGNVSEWCEDWLGDYGSATTDPTGPASGEYRVLRGGSWYDSARYCRSANRFRYDPGLRDLDLGFRLCCSALP